MGRCNVHSVEIAAVLPCVWFWPVVLLATIHYFYLLQHYPAQPCLEKQQGALAGAVDGWKVVTGTCNSLPLSNHPLPQPRCLAAAPTTTGEQAMQPPQPIVSCQS
jgi:hypothetical protein